MAPDLHAVPANHAEQPEDTVTGTRDRQDIGRFPNIGSDAVTIPPINRAND